MVDVYRARTAEWIPSPELRRSPAGVLVVREARREPGWMEPHWRVLLVPAGDRAHQVGQLLPDQAVAGWSVLVCRDQAVTR